MSNSGPVETRALFSSPPFHFQSVFVLFFFTCCSLQSPIYSIRPFPVRRIYLFRCWKGRSAPDGFRINPLINTSVLYQLCWIYAPISICRKRVDSLNSRVRPGRGLTTSRDLYTCILRLPYSTRASSRHRIQPFNTHRVSELCVVASERAVHSATAVAQSGRQLHVIFVFFFFFSPFPFFLHWRFLAFWFRFLLISSSSFFRRGDSATCRSFLLVIFFYRIASWHAWIDARYAIHVFRSVFFLFWSEMYKFRLFWLTRNSMIHN